MSFIRIFLTCFDWGALRLSDKYSGSVRMPVLRKDWIYESKDTPKFFVNGLRGEGDADVRLDAF